MTTKRQRTDETIEGAITMEDRLKLLAENQLIEVIEMLCKENELNRALVTSFLTSALNSDSETVLEALKSELQLKIHLAEEEEHLRVGKKYYLIDMATPTAEIVKGLYKEPRYKYANNPLLRVKIILLLITEALCKFDPEGKIYDFEGDEVLSQMDEEVFSLLEDSSSDINGNKEVLKEISKVFVNSNWKFFQDYGLFIDIDLESGELALDLLSK